MVLEAPIGHFLHGKVMVLHEGQEPLAPSEDFRVMGKSLPLPYNYRADGMNFIVLGNKMAVT